MRKQEKRESYNEFAKMISLQTKNLEKLLKRLSGESPEEIQQIVRDNNRRQTTRKETNHLRVDTKVNTILPSPKNNELY